ncbi:MAG: recombination mediator RecR [Bacteroidales bacterium]|nr:recombination mediator RecR [Bacteroidales bacterium]MCF8387865.1 recombination mediator RecR [Bacteroidales bacterium]MCF8399183.1 recombination mediator RecR [Bacteroidales bacterium]
MNNYSSKLLDQVVEEFAKLPGIGKKTALRLALHLLHKDSNDAESLANSLIKMKNEVQFCKFCHNISDEEVCEICSNPKREKSVLCVVEDIRDVIAIENTSQYRGRYHILGGIISPMEGIGPDDLNIRSLLARITDEDIEEIILALPTTIEGDTTSFYLYKQIRDLEVIVSTIARGISIGDDLEYADEVTLGRSILNRLPYESTIKK